MKLKPPKAKTKAIKPVEPTPEPASLPEDLREAAVELAPVVRQLRREAAKRPKKVRVGPPATRERLDALAKHYEATLLPAYTALMMLADGIWVEDSFVVFSIDELTSAKITKRSQKLRDGYDNCLPIGMHQLGGGWLYVMAEWLDPYCEKMMGIKVQRPTPVSWLKEMARDSKRP